VEDPEDIQTITGMVHYAVSNDLDHFVNSNGFERDFEAHSFAILDQRNRLFFLIEIPSFASFQRMRLEQEDQLEPLARFMEKYGISHIIGASEKGGDNYWYKQGNEMNVVPVVNLNLIWEKRIERAIFDYAKSLGMTNSQFLRFRLLVNASFQEDNKYPPRNWQIFAEDALQS